MTRMAYVIVRILISTYVWDAVTIKTTNIHISVSSKLRISTPGETFAPQKEQNVSHI